MNTATTVESVSIMRMEMASVAAVVMLLKEKISDAS